MSDGTPHFGVARDELPLVAFFLALAMRGNALFVSVAGRRQV